MDLSSLIVLNLWSVAQTFPNHDGKETYAEVSVPDRVMEKTVRRA
jgi:hypothetical protein